MISDKLLEYIEETRNCIRELELKPRYSRTGSVTTGSLSTMSVSNMSMELGSEKDIYTTDENYHGWDSMDFEVIFVWFDSLRPS